MEHENITNEKMKLDIRNIIWILEIMKTLINDQTANLIIQNVQSDLDDLEYIINKKQTK